jgi:hypothetical protein
MYWLHYIKNAAKYKIFGDNWSIMVGGAVAHPAATPEPDVRLSPHPALQKTGSCHEYLVRWTSSWQ